ncbi:hypothetical protein NUW54_g70 [Trametes sanguinea]|uniref:Uncharacterized protein n=1 Tax=Trametes sanguinea TaxID=158606 RepID=A0ACC1QDD0_9APHY|nr:hypothetical protein NUW54_g70 [Trametes sanguinea]
MATPSCALQFPCPVPWAWALPYVINNLGRSSQHFRLFPPATPGYSPPAPPPPVHWALSPATISYPAPALIPLPCPPAYVPTLLPIFLPARPS